MQSFCAKKFDFYGTTSIQPAYCPFFVQVDAGNSKNEYICAYMQKKKACKQAFFFSMVRSDQIRPLFFSSNSISVPLSFFSAILIISFSAKLMSASRSGFLSSA